MAATSIALGNHPDPVSYTHLPMVALYGAAQILSRERWSAPNKFPNFWMIFTKNKKSRFPFTDEGRVFR